MPLFAIQNVIPTTNNSSTVGTSSLGFSYNANGNVHLNCGWRYCKTMSNGLSRVQIDTNMYPHDDNVMSLGIISNRWSAVYAGTGTINTSDDNEKNTIVNSDLGF